MKEYIIKKYELTTTKLLLIIIYIYVCIYIRTNQKRLFKNLISIVIVLKDM